METIDWQLVVEGMRSGRYNLLLGAGASLDSFRPDGTNLPSLGGLQSELSAALPGVRNNSSINRLYRTLKADDRVDELITEKMCGCRAGPTNLRFTDYRWRRIFTLNIDDALEDAYSQNANRKQTAKIFNFNDPYEEIRNLEEVPIIHLHGFCRNSEDGYIFDIKEYTSHIRSNNIWAHVLGGLIRTEPFIIAGTSLEESDLTYFLADRSSVRLRADSPPSILIEPRPDDATDADCDEFKVVLFPKSALDFLTDLDGRMPSPPTVSDLVVRNVGEIDAAKVDHRELSEFYSDFERVPLSHEVGEPQGPSFAYGHQVGWSDLKADLDRSRSSQVALQSKLLAGKLRAFNLITGGAGAGKTTSLRRTAFNLAQLGHHCFWHRAIGKVRVDALRSVAAAASAPIYLFVDNIADYIVEFLDIRAEFSDSQVIIVGGERDCRLNHIKRVVGNSNTQEFELGQIGRNLAIDLVEDYKALGLANPQSGAYGYPIAEDLIAIACCRILNDFQPLETIIGRSISDATNIHRTCYMFVALASYCFRQGIAYDIASKQFPNYIIDMMAEDEESALPIEVVERSDVDFVSPLNQAFSDSIFRQWASENRDEALNTFVSLANAIRPKVSLNSIVAAEPAARLASRLFDYDEVVRPFLGIENAKEFFEQTKNAWDWNSRYWHQIAALRMDLASETEEMEERERLTELAVQHARFTKGIEANHQFTYTMIGRMLFRKFELLQKVKSSELSEAISALQRAIDIEDRKDRNTVHPYMILFLGLQSSFDLGARISPDEKSRVLDLIRRGQQLFPREHTMLEAAQNVRRSL